MASAASAKSERGILRALLKPRGDRRWDLFIRGTGLAALLLIPVAIYLPQYIALVFLVVVGLPANGPLGPVLPTAFEPVMWAVVKYHTPLQVTVVSLGVYMYMEYLNVHIFRWVLSFKKLEKLRTNRWSMEAGDHFARSPFATIVVFAATPLPFWICRCLAILRNYPIRPYMIATAIGRLPRLFVYAWLGEKLRLPLVVLVGIAVGGAALLVTWRLLSGKKVLPDVGE